MKVSGGLVLYYLSSDIENAFSAKCASTDGLKPYLNPILSFRYFSQIIKV